MKQETLPGEGMKPKVHKDISDAADDFVDAKAEAKRATEKKNERGDDLIRAMRKHKLQSYKDRSRGLYVEIDDSTKVKVKKGRPGEDVEET